MSNSKNFGKLLSLAVGAGVLVSATGIILYHYLYGRRYLFILERDLNKLNLSLAELRRELEDLRNKKQLAEGRKKSDDRTSRYRRDSRASVKGASMGGGGGGSLNKWKNSNAATANSSLAGSMASLSAGNFTDGGGSMYSAVESDDDDVEDEFCDITDSSDSEPSFPPKISLNRKTSTNSSITSLTRIPQVSCSAAALNDSLKLTYSSTSRDVTIGQRSIMEDLNKIDQLLDGNDSDKIQAYNTLTEMNKQTADDWKILWRLARASHALGTIEGAKGDQSKKQKYILEGLEFGKKGLEVNPNESKVHKWFAICVGARGQFSSTKEKIQDGVTYKEHVQKAIELDPTDATLYNLLARFEMEVASLSSMERRIAGWLFAEVPKGTFENAIAGFLKAEELNKKEWKENRLLLAKCYIQQGNYSDAIHWLDKALEVPPLTSEENVFDDEIRKLIKKYGSYRKT